MSDNSRFVEQILTALRDATTTEAMGAAAASLYVGVMPLLTPCCDGVLRRMRYQSWRDAEDLACDTIMTALPSLRDGRCPDASNGGLLRFLATIAHRDVLDEFRREGRDWKCDSNADLSGAVTIHTDESDRLEHSLGRTGEFAAAYEAAVAAMPARLREAWFVVVEQQTPIMDAAAQIGVDRITVWRRVRSARDRLAKELERFAP